MSQFIYFNVNPEGYEEEDCVIRAIKLATGLEYEEVEEKLWLTAELLNCCELCVSCYRHLLDDVFKFQRVECDGLTVGEFADLYPYGTYLVRMNGHLSCIINNSIYDIWDCRNEWLTDAWRVD